VKKGIAENKWKISSPNPKFLSNTHVTQIIIWVWWFWVGLEVTGGFFFSASSGGSVLPREVNSVLRNAGSIAFPLSRKCKSVKREIAIVHSFCQ